MNDAHEPWSPLKRIAFRFCCVLFGMSGLKMLACFFPFRVVFQPFWFVWQTLIDNLSPLLLHVKPIGTLRGSDSLTAWLLQIWTLIIALVVTLVWTRLAKASEYRRPFDAHV